jgi:hypothetical protein
MYNCDVGINKMEALASFRYAWLRLGDIAFDLLQLSGQLNNAEMYSERSLEYNDLTEIHLHIHNIQGSLKVISDELYNLTNELEKTEGDFVLACDEGPEAGAE